MGQGAASVAPSAQSTAAADPRAGPLITAAAAEASASPSLASASTQTSLLQSSDANTQTSARGNFLLLYKHLLFDEHTFVS